MYKVLALIVLSGFLGACSTLPEPNLKSIQINQQYPSNLLVECPEYKRYSSSEMAEVIATHAENMEKGILCRDRHNKLVELIQDREL